MSVITLTTDWSWNDYYVGAFKGAVFARNPGATIADIAHQLPVSSVPVAAFVIRSILNDFPEGTIHVVCVRSVVPGESRYLAAKIYGQYILTANNGLLSLVSNDAPDLVTDLKAEVASTFPEKDVLAKAACDLLEGKALETLGNPAGFLKKQVPFQAWSDKFSITGTVLHIDGFGNAITNISGKLFRDVGQGRPFRIIPGNNKYSITKISPDYTDGSDSDMIAVINSLDLLEIALINSNAQQLLNLETATNIRIVFI